MDYIIRYFFYIILGLFVLRLPHGTPGISSIFMYLILLSFCLSLPDLITCFPKLKKGGKIIYMFMVSLLLYLILVRVLKGDKIGINTITRSIIYPLTLTNLFMFSLKTDMYGKLKALNIVFVILIIVNTINIILYPKGWYVSISYTENWFLGYKNVIVRTLLPALTINGIISYHEKGRLSLPFIIMYLVSLITVAYVQSANGLIMMVFFGLLIFFRPIVSKFFEHKHFLLLAFIIPSIISVLVLLFNFQDNFSAFLETYLDRNATLTGRTAIWQFVITKILDSPVLGYGFHSVTEWRDLFNNFHGFGFSHPHNFLLYLLIQGGFVFLGLYILLLLVISWVVKDCEMSGEMFILLSMYCVFFIGGIAESLTDCPLMFPMLGLVYTLYTNKKYRVKLQEIIQANKEKKENIKVL